MEGSRAVCFNCFFFGGRVVSCFVLRDCSLLDRLLYPPTRAALHGFDSSSVHGKTLGEVSVRAVSISTPSAVTAMVCSYCALLCPSCS